MRALYACNEERFRAEADAWPEDLRTYCERLAAEAFGQEGPSSEGAPSSEGPDHEEVTHPEEE